MIDSNENEEKNIQNLNEIPPKDQIYPQIVFPLKKVGFPPTGLREML